VYRYAAPSTLSEDIFEGLTQNYSAHLLLLYLLLGTECNLALLPTLLRTKAQS